MSTRLVEDGEAESAVGVLDDLDLVHGVDDVVSTVSVDLVPLVRGADCNDGGTGSDTGLNTRRRIFKDDTSLGVHTEVGSGEEERVGERLSSLQS